MSHDDGAATMSREERLAGYKELRDGLEEMLATPDDERDGEVQSLIDDAMAELRTFAESLNAEETIEVTPGLVKMLVPASATTASSLSDSQSTDTTSSVTRAVVASDKSSRDDSAADTVAVIRFPPVEQPRLCAPYEVLYDGTTWYACVVTAVVPPAQPIDRVRYRVCILGYNVEEVVYSELLRPWQPSSTLTEQLGSGVRCHAIDPRTGRFAPAVVERLTLHGTVMVTFANTCNNNNNNNNNNKSDDVAAHTSTHTATTATTATASALPTELPLSHLRLGKVYAQLRKRPQLTDAERAQRRQAAAQRKRERAEVARQQRADQIAQDSSDWRALVGDLMGGGGGTATTPHGNAPRSLKRARFA